jgi:lysyl-tRNA synthetase class 2
MADTMRDTEQLVAKVTGGEVRLGDRRITARPPFARMTVAEAFREYAGVDEGAMLDLATNDEDTFFRLLVDRVEPGLARRDDAVFLTHYPATQASLARKTEEDPRFAERYELYVAGVELCNGFGELTCAVEQRARFEKDLEDRAALGLPLYPMDERFLEALAAGLPPCSGNAVGLDRLAAIAAGSTAIADVLAFTHDDL